MRWLAFGIMVTLACIRLSRGTIYTPPVSQFSGVPNLFGVCVYSFMCHHSLPSLGMYLVYVSNLAEEFLYYFFLNFSYSNITEKTHYWFAQPWLRDYFRLLFPPGLYWYICLWWNQWSIHTELSTKSRRTMVYESCSLFSESISGVYTFNKFSYHW